MRHDHSDSPNQYPPQGQPYGGQYANPPPYGVQPAPPKTSPNVPLIAAVGCGGMLLATLILGGLLFVVAGDDSDESDDETEEVRPRRATKREPPPPAIDAPQAPPLVAPQPPPQPRPVAHESPPRPHSRIILSGGVPCLLFHTPQRRVRRMLIGANPNDGVDEYSFSQAGQLILYLTTQGEHREYLFFDGHGGITLRQVQEGGGPRLNMAVQASDSEIIHQGADNCLRPFGAT